MPPHRPLPDRLWEKVRLPDDSRDCWEWTGAKHPQGHGQINVKRTPRYAHRIVFEWMRGPVPDGLVLDHVCKNPSCVNPWHLEPVTNAVNIRRGWDDGCKRGHQWTYENTYISKQGWRKCRTCHAAHERERQRRLREAA